MNSRTLLIGIDGASFGLIDGLLKDGVMPSLARLVAEGVRARLCPAEPAGAASEWACLVTGRPDAAAGPTIWSIVHAHGMRVTALNLPAMSPAAEVSGFVLPGGVLFGQLPHAGSPPGLLERLGHLPGVRSGALGALGDGPEGAAADAPSRAETLARHDEAWLEVLRHLGAESPTELSAIVFDGAGRLPATDGLGPAGSPEAAPPARANALEYFRRLDRVLAGACEGTAETAVLVVSMPGPAASPSPVDGAPPDHRRGVFVARGPGIRAGLDLPEVSVLDVAPTLLHLLGVKPPAEIPGRVRVEALQGSDRGRGGLEPPPLPAIPAARALAVEEERLIADRLRELGYIE